MKTTEVFQVREPKILKDEILILRDEYFHAGNVVIVTGGASGIGRATAVAMAVNGVTAVATDVNEQGGQETVQMSRELGGKVIFVKADLTKDEEIEELVSRASQLGTIRFLANIAGIQHIDPIEGFPMEKYDLMLRVMVRAPFYLSKLCIPHMKKTEDGIGAIGNMSSVHGHLVTRNKPVYNITKFALRGLTQSIAAEGEGKIRGFSVSVGFVKTPLTLNQIPDQAEQRGIPPEEIVRTVMMGRSQVKEMMTPVEVANLFVAGFSSFLGAYLVGGDLLFDGGITKTY
jgi:3-hydroxybutyrate dehydrogenase